MRTSDAAAPESAPQMPAEIDVTWLSRSAVIAACGYRLLFVAAISVFLTVYVFLAVPSVFEVQPVWLIVQPIILLSAIVGLRAIGSPVRASGAAAIILLWLFALCLLEAVTAIWRNQEAINAYSEKYPVPGIHEYVAKLGPDGPYYVFLGILGPLTGIFLAGAIAAVVLRWRRIPRLRATLRRIDRNVRHSIERSGDAPSLLRLLCVSRKKGWWAGVAAAAMLFVPFLITGREAVIPRSSGWMGWLPDRIAWAVTFANDRVSAIIVCVSFAVLLWRIARWHLLPEARFVLVADQRPPILLLRSFMDDHVATLPKSLVRRLLHPLLWPLRALGGTSRVGLWLRGLTRRRIEEVAADLLRDTGPFIAIGDRGDKAPELGAFRAVLGDDEWQDYVRCWMRTSRLVVMVAGRSPSVQWELRTAAELGVLPKMLLTVPPGSPDETWQRWRVICDCLVATRWASSLEQISPRRVLVLRFYESGEVLAITGHGRGERDYDIALRVGKGLVVAGQ